MEQIELRRPRYLNGPLPLYPSNIYEIHRGDNFSVPIIINLGDKFRFKQYILRPKDKVYVSIAEPNQPWECSLIRKTLTRKDFDSHKNAVFKLEPQDTEFVMPGRYYIEIKIQLSNGKVHTILPKKQFWVVE